MNNRSRQSSVNTQSQQQTQQQTLPGASPEELAIIQQIRNYGGLQGQIWESLAREVMGPQPMNAHLTALSPQDEQYLNQSYQAAMDETMRQAGILGGQLGGVRGMRRSSGPIAQAVGQEVMPVIGNLQSQRAQQRLGLGLNIRDFNEDTRRYNQAHRLGLTQTGPQNLNNLANYYASNRFAQPTITGSMSGTSSTQNTYSPSMMQNIGAGMGLFQQGMGIAGALKTGLPGMGGAGMSTSFNTNPLFNALGQR